MMRPERVDHRSGKGLVIIHRCVRCGLVRANRLARDTAQEDDIAAVGDLLSGRSGSPQ
jgi:RNHCP domain